MSDWAYLRVTIDIAVDMSADEADALVSLLRREEDDLQVVLASADNFALQSAIQEGWVEIDGICDVEEH